jgi:hypothetical protein
MKSPWKFFFYHNESYVKLVQAMNLTNDQAQEKKQTSTSNIAYSTNFKCLFFCNKKGQLKNKNTWEKNLIIY